MDFDGDCLEIETAPNSFGGRVIYRYIKSIHSGNIASCKLLFKDTFSKGLILLLCKLVKTLFFVCLIDGV